MKTSPFQLKWVSYPEASYETNADYEPGDSDLIEADVEASVTYDLSGEHLANLKLTSRQGGGESRYRFTVSVIAAFSFDLDTAVEVYKANGKRGLPPIIAVNISRVLYSGARELIAMMTARAPYGPAVLSSALLEPRDVQISSAASPIEILREIFKADEDELAAMQRRQAQDEQKVSADAKQSKRSKKKA